MNYYGSLKFHGNIILTFLFFVWILFRFVLFFNILYLLSHAYVIFWTNLISIVNQPFKKSRVVVVVVLFLMGQNPYN